MVAARVGAAPVVAQLLAKGAKVNLAATRGQTALMWAVAQQHPAVVKLLIDGGADIHAKSAVWSQVMAVSPHGMLQYNQNVPHGGETALLFAARNGDLASATLLVAAGANVNDADGWGISATAFAAHAGFPDIVDLLLAKGADPNTNGGGFTPLHAAVMRRDDHMVEALLARKADPNARVESWTPTRRSSRDWNFNPELVGATPYWLAARAMAPNCDDAAREARRRYACHSPCRVPRWRSAGAACPDDDAADGGGRYGRWHPVGEHRAGEARGARARGGQGGR